MSIKARLVITISLLVAIAFVLIGTVTVTATRSRMVERVDDTLFSANARIPRGGFDKGPGGRDDYSKRQTATIVLAADGTQLAADPSGFADDPDPLPDLGGVDLAASAGEILTAEAADGSDARYRVLIRPTEDGLFLAIAAPLADVDATVRNLTAIVAIVGALVLAGVVATVWFTIRRGLRPIDAMIGTAGQIAAGDLSQRVDHEDETTEVGKLGAALNEMLARIESSFAAKEASERRLRQFVADASHELRTPLTSIRGYAELYRSGAAADPAGIERVMARIESEGTRMSRLVEDLLLLARLDQGRPLQREPVDLAAALDDAVMDARAVEPDRPISWQRPAASAIVEGDADRLRQIAGNLLANARMHTDPGTPVRVSLDAGEREVTFRVADEGPGIAPEDAARVFDRFYRADPSRARSKGGTGLGLSIVASIAGAHGGRVALDSTPGAGTTVSVTLPRARDGVMGDAAVDPKVASTR